MNSLSFALAVNDGIYATANLNVRQSASTSATLLATVPINTAGLIVGGPIMANGYTWWQITWGSPYVTGWSVQDFLATTNPSGTVYSDYVWPGWHVTGTTNMSSLTTSTTRRNGTYGIQAIASTSARLYIQTSIGFNTTTQQTLRFSVMSPSGNGQNHYVGIYNTGGNIIQLLPLWNYVSGNTLVPNIWYDIIIPLSDLNASNQIIGGIGVQIQSAGSFFLDDIGFSAASGSTYWTPPVSTITSVSISCAPSSIQVNGSSQCSASVGGTGSYNSAVTWTASLGSINSSGLFMSPSSAMSSTGVTIMARSVQDPSKTGTSVVTVNPLSTQNTQASPNVFGNAFGAGWYIGNWNQVTTNIVDDVTYNSDFGLKIQVATPLYGRVQFRTQPNYAFNTTGQNFLSFVINIAEPENENLYVGLLDAAGTAFRYVQLAPYTSSRKLGSYEWQVVNIPLASTDLNAVNTVVYGVEIQSIYPSTFYVDEIKFTGVCYVP